MQQLNKIEMTLGQEGQEIHTIQSATTGHLFLEAKCSECGEWISVYDSNFSGLRVRAPHQHSSKKGE